MGILDQNLGTPTPESPVATPSFATGLAGFTSGLLDVATSVSKKKETGALTEKQIFDMEGNKLAGDIANRAKAAENQGKFRLRDSIVSDGIVGLSKKGYDVGSFASTFSAFGVSFDETMTTPRERAIAAVKDNPTFQTNLVAAIGQFDGDVNKATDYALSKSVNQEARKQALMEGTAGGLRSVPEANAYLNDYVQTELSVANTFTSKGVLFTKDQVAQREAIYAGEALQLRGSISASYGSDNASRIEALKLFDEADAGRKRIFKEIGELAEKDLETATKEYYINAVSGLISASTKGLTHTDDKGNVTIIPDNVARLAISAYKQMSINDDKLGVTALQKQGYDTMIKLMELVPEPSVATKWGFDSQLQAETKVTPKAMFDDTPTPAGSDVKKTIDGLDKLTNEFGGMESNPEAKQMAFLTAGQSAGVVAKMNGVLSAKDTQALAMSGYKKLAQDIGRTDPSQGRALALRWKEAHKMQEQKANRAMADLGVGLFDGDGSIKSDGLLKAASEAVSRMNGQEKLSAANLLQTLDQVANEAYGGDKLAAIEDRGRAFGRLGTEERRFFAVLNSEEYFGDSRIEKYKEFRDARDTHKILRNSWDSDVKSYDKKENIITDPIFGSFGEGIPMASEETKPKPLERDTSSLPDANISFVGLEELSKKKDLIGTVSGALNWVADQVVSPTGAATLTTEGATNPGDAAAREETPPPSLGSQVDAITSSGASREEQLTQLRALVENRYANPKEPPIPRPKPEAKSMSYTAPEKQEDVKDYAKRIIELESSGGPPKLVPYKPDPTEPYYTVGHGHYGPDVDPNKKYTREEVDALFEKDVKDKLNLAKKTLPEWETYSKSLRVELLQAFFRGDFPKVSPKALRLINARKFDEAADEFLNNEEYRTATVENNLRGIRARMEAVAIALREEAVLIASLQSGKI
jgi:GH24 family phage-related lysozyme (muramidase)